MLLYALTIFVSAFLLFQVQPIIGRIILPWFGGSAAVWTTALMFFQVVLLAGYLYAYCSIRYLKPKQQALVHIALLVSSFLLLPILPSGRWLAPGGGAPALHILALLTTTIGLPYFLLSTTGPLLQAWYVRTYAGSFPYRLYALSNFGSMLALLGFPFLVEPLLTTRSQAYTWSGAYVLFAGLCALAAWHSRAGSFTATAGNPGTSDAPRPHGGLLALWATLAACASVLLLAVTSQMTQNVAPIPFLWVVPLSLYLLSFILCFESEQAYQRKVFLPLLAAALGGMAYTLYAGVDKVGIKVEVPVFAAGLFVCCMCCHGELARLKPHPRYLTTFYLMVSLGGAAGGLFVALAAPNLFRDYLELPLALWGCAFLLTLVLWRQAAPAWVRYAAVCLTVALAGYMTRQQYTEDRRFRLSARNFYGTLAVRDDPETEENAMRRLYHGTIQHGVQLLAASRHRVPTSYYGPNSGVARALKLLQQSPSIRVGVVGLGAGVLAAYGRPGDVYRFYEINPLVLKVANTEFTFLRDCPADKQVWMGDARLTMERQPIQNFDLLAVDAFSSDSIPVHLLTREAFELYFRHLKTSGILAVHISNRYLDLEPVVARDAQDVHKKAVVVEEDDEGGPDYIYSNTWVLVSSDCDRFNGPYFEGTSIEPAKARLRLRPWTDDYSNLFQVLK